MWAALVSEACLFAMAKVGLKCVYAAEDASVIVCVLMRINTSSISQTKLLQDAEESRKELAQRSSRICRVHFNTMNLNVARTELD